jgi:hypothetical protein
MKGIFTERNFVIVLFILVFITFSVAQNETKKIEHLYNAGQLSIKTIPSFNPEARASTFFSHQVRTY